MVTVRKNPQGASEAIRSLLKQLLEADIADRVFTAAKTPYSNLPMPALIADPEEMKNADPLAPVAPFNAARQAAAILRHGTDKRLALVLRPCEIRALVELSKLNQAVLDSALIIGIECMGRMENDVYLEQAQNRPDLVREFYEKEDPASTICTACAACEQFVPTACDLIISVFGMNFSEGAAIFPATEKGNAVLEKLGAVPSETPAEHQAKIAAISEKRSKAKAERITRTSEKISSLNTFESMIANCLNCYSCRTACPVCYCKECVFLTDVFAHDPELLIRRAQKKGMIKLPTDTTMFHLTRLAHMAHACVACGHCTSVCPSHIPVADIFTTVGARVQEMFGYLPGKDPEEPIPYQMTGKKE